MLIPYDNDSEHKMSPFGSGAGKVYVLNQERMQKINIQGISFLHTWWLQQPSMDVKKMPVS